MWTARSAPHPFKKPACISQMSYQILRPPSRFARSLDLGCEPQNLDPYISDAVEVALYRWNISVMFLKSKEK